MLNFKQLRLSSSPITSKHHVQLRFFSSTSAATIPPSSTQLHHHQEPLYHDPRFYFSALFNSKTITEIKQVHAHATQTGTTQYLPLANKLLYLYTRYNSLDYAYALFERMVERDPVSWSVMLGGLTKNGDNESALVLFREIIRSGVRMDSYILPFAFRACRDTLGLEMGRMIHHLVYKYGMQLDNYVLAAVVDMYAKCGVIDDARKVFDQMLERDLVTWTVMIYAYADCGNPKESLVLCDKMMEEGVVPDKVAIVTVVYACAKLGAMNKARLVHEYILGKRFFLDVVLGTAMIDMYAKCGSVDAAREIFDVMKVKNVVSWSAMIAAYGYHGRGKEALELFTMMLDSGISPNRITFVSLLYACSHAGLVDEGLRFFQSMSGYYSVIPDVKHYTCMVDLLGRAGRLDEALKLIDSMKIDKDAGLWSALLGACRIHGNIELAERAAKSLLELQPSNPGHYVLLSNIYAKAGRWGKVGRMRELMTSRRLKKIPGWTWIEVDDKIHQFNVGDSSHPDSKEIHMMLKSLRKKLELAGYVPDTNFVLHDVDEELKEEILYTHSEKLAIAFGLISTPEGTPIRITKNLRVCGDCHTFSKLVSSIVQREIVVRDANRFHHFKGGTCSCGDYW